MKRFRILLILVCSIFCAFSLSAFADSKPNKNSFSPTQVKDIQQIVYNYLLNNPEILIKVSKVLQEKQAAEAQKSALSAIKASLNNLFNDPKTPTAGNLNGQVEVVEFFDYQCGHCKVMAPVLASIIKSNPNVKVIFKELPIFGNNSRYAAKAALAAIAQGKYYAFHNALFASKTPLSPAIIMNAAKTVTLNTNQIKTQMNAPWINKQIRDNFQLAQKLKLLGTPAFIVSNKSHTKFRFIPGATSKQMLSKAITAVSSK